MNSRRAQNEGAEPRRNAEQAVFLQVQRTAQQLMDDLAQLLKGADLSPTQYNVLRILRAAGPQGLASGQIARKMITREPDMTRLLDRLETRGLIERCRGADDRRIVRGRITDAGRRLRAPLDPKVLQAHRRQLGHLSRPRLRTLSELLAEVRRRTG